MLLFLEFIGVWKCHTYSDFKLVTVQVTLNHFVIYPPGLLLQYLCQLSNNIYNTLGMLIRTQLNPFGSLTFVLSCLLQFVEIWALWFPPEIIVGISLPIIEGFLRDIKDVFWCSIRRLWPSHIHHKLPGSCATSSYPPISLFPYLYQFCTNIYKALGVSISTLPMPFDTLSVLNIGLIKSDGIRPPHTPISNDVYISTNSQPISTKRSECSLVPQH